MLPKTPPFKVVNPENDGEDSDFDSNTSSGVYKIVPTTHGASQTIKSHTANSLGDNKSSSPSKRLNLVIQQIVKRLYQP